LAESIEEWIPGLVPGMTEWVNAVKRNAALEIHRSPKLADGFVAAIECGLQFTRCREVVEAVL